MTPRTRYGREKILQAIKTMQDAVDESNRLLSREDMSDIETARDVLHEFTWGMANALTGLEGAISSSVRRLDFVLLENGIDVNAKSAG